MFHFKVHCRKDIHFNCMSGYVKQNRCKFYDDMHKCSFDCMCLSVAVYESISVHARVRVSTVCTSYGPKG